MSPAIPVRCLQLSKFYPPVLGGLESVVHALTEGLVRRGHAVEVLCANTGRTTVREMGPYPVTRAASWGKLLSTSMSPALARELLRHRRRHDIVHVHLPDPMANLALCVARPSARLVVHWHSDVVNQQRALKLYAPLQNWLLDRADAVIATSEPYSRSSPWLQPYQHKVHVIPIGIQAPRFDNAAASQIRQRYAGKRIVFSLGRMVYYKGFGTLIEATRSLPNDVVVLVGGSGELLESHRAAARSAGVDGRISFVGRLEDADVAAHMKACDVFCLPSTVRAEAFGVVLLEAMAAGRPIVATHIEGSGVPWVSPHGVSGLNVPINNPVALTRALTAVLDDANARARYGAAARRRFDELFTADRMVAATAVLYRHLLEECPRHAAAKTR